ncbi:MAG: hypothetical protein V1910_03135 [bacterium]
MKRRKKLFLEKIDKKWNSTVVYVLGKQKEGVLFADFPQIRKFYGFANDTIKDEARKKLYDEAWKYFSSLDRDRSSLGKEEKEELTLFDNLFE